MTYFDTGYLIKCYLQETGSAEVRALASRLGHIASSAYGRMELHSAFHRKLREGAIAREQLEVILRQFELDETNRLWTWLPLTESMAEKVASTFRALAPSVFLRTGDAIHLITARDHSFAEIYSSDIHLIAAAPHFGLAGQNIIAANI